MPAYSFEALDAQGQTRKGIIDADTARAARNLLRGQSLVPLEVKPVSAQAASGGAGAQDAPRAGWNLTLWQSRVFGSSALAVWTRQLADLVSAGLPLEQALSALAEEFEDARQRALVATLRAEVHGGSSFARALSLYPREFSEIYRAVVEAGEHSGRLALVLDKLAADLADGQALRGKLLAAVLYPAVVTLVAIAIVIFLLSYVVPQVAQVFAGSKHALPWLTVLMMQLSDAVRHHGVAMLLGLAALTFIGRRLLRVDRIRQAFDGWWLTLPIIGRLASGYNAARFASTLAMLAAAGVPILKALQAAADTLGNAAMRADAQDALVLVREGAPLASALQGKRGFPALVGMFARLGEQTGQLPLMLQRAATLLATDVQRRSMQLATILEPLLIVGMGGMVMLIVLAVLMPIIELNQWVG
ncbi:MAG: Type II secretion system protein F [Paracidovorax wautersii]|uniref:General secretion pathway protein F n=1 Tax=Paracidovorax wautersii TaxID=1177982 RepID=A0A7V8JP27_9BURK|nr:MAG: Type II secretion system protein F [Paracidovorax wautersii]